jgi:NSS family neurotransmitter:Na+ symporter
LGILTAFLIFTYYCVIAGWTLGYAAMMASSRQIPFDAFAANPVYTIGLSASFLLLNGWIVSFELSKGIEKFSKIFIPLIFVLLGVLIVKCAFLEGSFAGYQFYLYPDWSRISWHTPLAAMSQAFFSLCIGEAVLITYGSYLAKEEDLFASALYIALFDLLVALLAGLVIFPALFAFQMAPDQGVGLIFKVLPKVFSSMEGGALFGFLFFLLLTLAALTTAMALLEMPVSFLVERGLCQSRKRAVWLMTALAFCLAIPSALSTGASAYFSELQLESVGKIGFLAIMDFIAGDLGMAVTGLLTCIFVGWVWGAGNAAKEIASSSPAFLKIAPLWQVLVRYFAPLVIFVILSTLL